MTDAHAAASPPWWRGAVIYQIYPRSFADGNDDGVGDLPGIRARLPYVASLGVDAVWISPFFVSPMKDFGYDVSDYRAVDPIFGTLADFSGLVGDAHALGLKVIIDQVLSHTSDRHAWFQESRSSRDNPRADWYVWADPKPDGTPPNNWLAIFGGPAWEWDTHRRQYYMHNFLASQPDLNFHSPAVQDQILQEMRFWLELGVDGFRLDTVNFYFHGQSLRDNPPHDVEGATRRGVPPTNPYGYQTHLYDKTQPENLAFLTRLRKLMDGFGATTTIGEIGADDGIATIGEYTAGEDRLHMAYAAGVLGLEFNAETVRGLLEDVNVRAADGWPCWAFGNHDDVRVLTRWGGPDPKPAFARLLMALLTSLRGSVCVYQGEELGLPEADVPFARLQDPYGIRFWPDFKGRDGCRTPIPWERDAPHAGFSTAEPWLPVPATHAGLAVDAQAADPDSTLNAYRGFLAWRRGQPALRYGDQTFLDLHPPLLGFVRAWRGEAVLAVFNLGREPARVAASALPGFERLIAPGTRAEQDADGLVLPGYGTAFARVIALSGVEAGHR